ncbi:hypothetical protein D3C84_486400 [compost metagenome]
MFPPERVGNDEHQRLACGVPGYFTVVMVIEFLPIALQVNPFAFFSPGVFDDDGHAILRIMQIHPTFVGFQHSGCLQWSPLQDANHQCRYFRITRPLPCLLDAIIDGH